MSNNLNPFILEKLLSKDFKTPFYLYNLKQIETQFINMQNALTSRFIIYYSMKANPNQLVLQKLHSLGSGIDISSLGEMIRAFDAGFSPQEMSFVGPGKTEDELLAGLEKNIEYTVIESIQELELFSRLVFSKKTSAKFCIRVNPSVYASSNGQTRTAAASHFGIDDTDISGINSILEKNRSLVFSGLHFYLHSQFLEASIILNNFYRFVDIAVQIQKNLNIKFEVINFGGGFGIPYFNGQNSLDLSQLSLGIESFLAHSNTKELSGAKFCVESGRYLVGPCGYFVTKILYKKKSRDKTFLVCDGGMTQHQAAVGVGQVLRRNFPIKTILASKLANYRSNCSSMDHQQTLEKVTIVGPSCYSMDVLAQDIEIDIINQGDFIVVEQSGAYGPSFSPENFLSRNKANEYAYENI